jgi:hypothetical protein
VSDVAGQAYALTMLAPILPGREGALQDHLERLPQGAGSPLARLTGTHFARWVILPHLVYQGPPQRRDTLASQYLLFTACFDGPRDPYLAELCDRIPAEADAIWGHCVGYPGTRDAEAFARYVRHNQIPTSFFVAAYPERTVGEVRAALELRERLVAFAVEAQGMEAARLHEAFLATFARPPALAAAEPQGAAR